MKRTAIAKTPTLALLVALAAVMLGSSATQAQMFFHLITVETWLSGPNGDSVVPCAHVGETVNVHVRVNNLDTYMDSISVNSVSLVIHHANGDAIVPNLTPDPLIVSSNGESAEVSNHFVVRPEDEGMLLIDGELLGTDNWDGFMPGVPMGFRSVWSMQVRILKPALEVSQMDEVSTDSRWVTFRGAVTNSGNTTLSNIVVVSDNGTPEDQTDDTTIEIGILDPHSATSYEGSYRASGSVAPNTVTARATDPIGFVVNHSTRSITPGKPSPALRIAKQGATMIKVSWPVSAEGFHLESTDEVGPNRLWRAVANSPLAGADEFSVLLGVSCSARFFRLAK